MSCGPGYANLSNQCKKCLLLYPTTTNYSNYYHNQCVALSGCDTKTIGNNLSYQCELCTPSNPYALDTHISCVASKNLCGAGKSDLNSKYQCINCIGSDVLKPFSTIEHDNCVAVKSCDSGTQANSLTKQCEYCSPLFASVDHLLCIPSKLDCGDGMSVIADNQCINCSEKNTSKPFATINHDDCVEASGCSNGAIADQASNQCTPCYSPKK